MWAYFEGVPPDGLWLGKIGDHAFLASPTDAGLFMAAVVPSVERRDELRADREAGYAAALAEWPELNACLDGARRVGPVRMMSRWHGFFRESAGPGWVLVGDASHFKDPSPGQGIADALRQAEHLAPAIQRALDGDDDALARWAAWRDRDAWEMYWFAHDLGAPGPTPLIIQEIQRRAAGAPALTRGLIGVLNHEVAPSEVFTPSLALRGAASALRTGRGQRRVLLRELRQLVG